MWFLHQKVLLTKDNLAKRNCQGSKKCCFCDQDDSIQHIFIWCLFAKVLWRIVHLSFNFLRPTNVTNLFGNWLAGVAKKIKHKLELLYVLHFGKFGILTMIIYLTMQKTLYTAGYSLDLYVVLPTTNGEAQEF
jgi:hypothetical protein